MTDSVVLGFHARPLDWSAGSSIAVDVSKATLECFDGKKFFSIPNGHFAQLETLRPSFIVLESTGVYSVPLERWATSCKIPLYRVNTLRFKRYRDQVSQDVKTDARDAELLLDFFRQFGGQLYQYDPAMARLHEFLFHRRIIGESISRWKILKESAAYLEEERIKEFLDWYVREFSQRRAELDKEMEAVARPDLRKLFGLVLTVKLTSLNPARFSTSKKWVSFLGLKLRTYESGTIRKRRSITKHGDESARSLLYLRAMLFIRWKVEPYYGMWTRLKAKGKPGYTCMVALMNKVARRFWAEYHRTIDESNTVVQRD